MGTKDVSSRTYFGMKDPSKELIDYFREEAIGVECTPKCGNCLCGKCTFGAKKLSLADERKYADFQSRLVYDKKGTVDDPGPYFVVQKFPYIIPKEQLVDNNPAVLRVMRSTERKLENNKSWRKVYESRSKIWWKGSLLERLRLKKLILGNLRVVKHI